MTRIFPKILAISTRRLTMGCAASDIAEIRIPKDRDVRGWKAGYGETNVVHGVAQLHSGHKVSVVLKGYGSLAPEPVREVIDILALLSRHGGRTVPHLGDCFMYAHKDGAQLPFLVMKDLGVFGSVLSLGPVLHTYQGQENNLDWPMIWLARRIIRNNQVLAADLAVQVRSLRGASRERTMAVWHQAVADHFFVVIPPGGDRL